MRRAFLLSISALALIWASGANADDTTGTFAFSGTRNCIFDTRGFNTNSDATVNGPASAVSSGNSEGGGRFFSFV
jgi:hypothetical protein